MSESPETPQAQLAPIPLPPEVKRPWWVRLGLWGLSTRASVKVCIWASLLLATASAVASIWYRPAAVGIVFLVGVWWYRAAMRWVDRYGEWK